MPADILPMRGPTHIFMLDLVCEVCKWDDHCNVCTVCRLWSQREIDVMTPCNDGLVIAQRILQMLRYRY